MIAATKLVVGIFVTASMGAVGSETAVAQEVPKSLSQANILSGSLKLTLSSPGHAVHIMPIQSAAKLLPNASVTQGALSYHGGPIMPSTDIYNIFWVGALQRGGTASLTSHYETVANNFATDYGGHSLDSNDTQYYQTPPIPPIWISGNGTLSGTYIDTDPFPSSGCSHTATPGNCITDAQLQAEIRKVLTIKGWTGGLNKIFLVYTGHGEGSCFDSSSRSCAYTAYCAYHGAFTFNNKPVIYGNEPYAGVPECEVPTSPSGDLPADSAVNVASHEVTEATTDPLLNAWWDSANGEEIGDLCAWNFGSKTYDNGLANQQWNGRYYMLQTEYDNHNAACRQVGPN